MNFVLLSVAGGVQFTAGIYFMMALPIFQVNFFMTCQHCNIGGVDNVAEIHYHQKDSWEIQFDLVVLPHSAEVVNLQQWSDDNISPCSAISTRCNYF